MNNHEFYSKSIYSTWNIIIIISTAIHYTHTYSVLLRTDSMKPSFVYTKSLCVSASTLHTVNRHEKVCSCTTLTRSLIGTIVHSVHRLADTQKTFVYTKRVKSFVDLVQSVHHIPFIQHFDYYIMFRLILLYILCFCVYVCV